MDYDEVVERLFSRHRSVQSSGFSSDAYKPGLEVMREYAELLGNPHERFRCIHVAGTNGKGSVCSMIAAALAAMGFRTGLYTSPHLIDFRERIKILEPSGAGMIPKEAVCEFLEKYDRDGLTFFEVTTGMAFWWFARQEVDVVVVETGLGGLLDSTNIITPRISIITSIGLDHCGLLGGTRAEIAFQKAGIFKPGVPALAWGRDAETQPVFEEVAAAKGSPLYFAEDFKVPAGFPPLDLEGPCQDINLRTVCAALSILYGGGPAPEVQQAIAHAAALTGFHGRWEILQRSPLTICDIAHNPPALAANMARLEQLGRPMLIVFGLMADKDIDAILPLLPAGAEYFPVQPRTPRAMTLDDLALKLKHFNTSPQPSVAGGVKTALQRAAELQDAVIYIGGSTYVVSEAISYLQSI